MAAWTAVLLLLALSCKKEKSSLPISEEELVTVMADVHLAEAALQDQYGMKKDSLARLYYRQIYRLHGITEEDFQKTMKRLRNDPGRVEQLYERVLEELSKQEAEIQGQPVVE
jgi:hypothetical protein